MKRTLLSLFLMTSFTMVGQIVGTNGFVTLNSNLSMDLKINSSTGMTTLTLVAPDNVWFAVGFGGQRMSDGADVFRTDGTNITDARSTGRFLPPSDASQDWSLVSNNVNGNTRTMVVQRANDTGDSDDFVFSTSTGSISVIWAHGTSNSYAYHGTNRGATAFSTLSTKEEKTLDFSIYPNPTTDLVTIQLPSGTEKATARLFDTSGRLIAQQEITTQNRQVSLSNLSRGVYFVRVSSDNRFGAQRIIKN